MNSLVAATLRDKLSKHIKRDYSEYADNPVEFAFDVLRIKVLTDQQKEILNTIKDNKYIAIPAGHGLGKSWIMAVVVLWFLYTRRPARVITTAPNKSMVEGILWKYIADFHTKAGLHGEMLTTKLTIGKENGEPTWYAEGFTAKDSVGFQGRHSANVMVVFDEAVGIPTPHWDSAKSLTMSPSDKIIAIGNPTTNSCQFRVEIDTGIWKVIKMSCLDHPNVKLGKVLIKGAVTREWIEERRKQYGGEHTDLFRSRVLGEFPLSSSESVFNEAWVDNCMSRPYEYDQYWGEKTPVVVSCDVSGGSSDAATFTYIYRDGFVVQQSFLGMDEVDCANELLKWADRSFIVIDDIGVGGGVSAIVRRVTNYLSQMNVSGNATRPEFFNIRSEMYFLLSRALRDDVLTLNPQGVELKRQLICMKKVDDYNANNGRAGGKWRLEPKQDIKKRLGRSPDNADSLAMAYYHYERLYLNVTLDTDHSAVAVENNPYSANDPFEFNDNAISMFDRIETIMP